MKRGDIWWAALGPPTGSEPGFRRPVIIVSADALNDSAIRTVLTVPLTANQRREEVPGNVPLPSRATGLSKNSVAIVAQVGVMNRHVLTERIGRVPNRLMADLDDGLRLALAL